MTPQILKRIAPVTRLLLTAALLVPNLARAAKQQDHVHLCWAMGRFDHTIFFAEVENREDRQASFAWGCFRYFCLATSQPFGGLASP